MKRKSLVLLLILFITIFITTACDKKEDSKRNGYDYLVLVNKYSKLPDDWEKNVKLISTKNAWNEDIKVEKEAYEQYKKLAKELEKDGVTIELDSVYRSVKAQQDLWDEWSADPEKGIDYVKKFVAVPGYSEHHTGLAIDICIRKGKKLEYDNDEMIADRKTFKKVHKKLAKYGFILRYLENRDDSTGYTYEPWHLRYVGSSKIAKEIMDKSITLEEYLDSIKDIKNNKSAAKYKVEKTLQEYFKEIYGDNITNSRFNVKKIYNEKEANKTIKSLGLNKEDIAFEVEYELMPSENADIKPLTVVDGEYDEITGWVININRLGILKYNKKNNTYTIKNFGTGW